jgi:hypothetical protein
VDESERERERKGWGYARKTNMEGEIRRLGQAVGEIDPGWGSVKGVSDRRKRRRAEGARTGEAWSEGT